MAVRRVPAHTTRGWLEARWAAGPPDAHPTGAAEGGRAADVATARWGPRGHPTHTREAHTRVAGWQM
eukprot:5628281-Alexandrium_andersonii.AAC.1